MKPGNYFLRNTEMVFFVTAFHNLGPSELAKIPDFASQSQPFLVEVFLVFSFLWKISQAGGEVNILQNQGSFLKLNLKSFFFKEFCSSASFNNFFLFFISVSSLSCQLPKTGLSWAPRDLKHLGRLGGTWMGKLTRGWEMIFPTSYFLGQIGFLCGRKNLWNHFRSAPLRVRLIGPDSSNQQILSMCWEF